MSTSAQAPIRTLHDFRQRITDGWELWHLADSPLPGRWEFRRDHERLAVHWDAIEQVRRHAAQWVAQRTVFESTGRWSGVYRPRQSSLQEPGE